jgi:hypothetical protein
MTAARPTEPPTSGDSAMATGSDAGAPADHLAPAPLNEQEREMLNRLRADDPPALRAEPALEDSPAVAEAANDDAPLPVGNAGGPAASGDVTPGDADGPAFVAPPTG